MLVEKYISKRCRPQLDICATSNQYSKDATSHKVFVRIDWLVLHEEFPKLFLFIFHLAQKHGISTPYYDGNTVKLCYTAHQGTRAKQCYKRDSAITEMFFEHEKCEKNT